MFVVLINAKHAHTYRQVVMVAAPDAKQHNASIKLYHSIKGLSKVVNKSVISTTIFRVHERYAYKHIIVDMYGWLHAAKQKPDVVRLLALKQPCPPLLEFIERRIERLNSNGNFKVNVQCITLLCVTKTSKKK